MPPVHTGLLLKGASRASSTQICLSLSVGMLEHHHPCLPRFPCHPCLFLGLAGFQSRVRVADRGRSGWEHSQGAWDMPTIRRSPEGQEDWKPWRQTRLSLPHHPPPPSTLLVLPTQHRPGGCWLPASAYLLLCSCLYASVGLQAHVGVPALAWGRTGPHTVPEHLSFVFDLSPNPKSSYVVF